MGTILAHFEWRWTVSSIYISLQRGQLLILKPYLGARLRRRDQGGSLRTDMRQRYPQVSPDFAKSSPDLASHRLIWDVVVVREILPRPQLPVNRCFPILATAGFVTRARIVQVKMERLTLFNHYCKCKGALWPTPTSPIVFTIPKKPPPPPLPLFDSPTTYPSPNADTGFPRTCYSSYK